MCAPDFEITGNPSPGETADVEGMKAFTATMRDGFPDVRYEDDADQMIVDDGVACYFVGTGTHQGELMGVEPTGNDGETHGALLIQVDDGVMKNSQVV